MPDSVPVFTDIVEINDHIRVGRLSGETVVALRHDRGWQFQRITAFEGKKIAETLRQLTFGA